MDECQQQLDFEELEKLCRHTPEDYLSEEEQEEEGNDVGQKVGAGGEEGGGIVVTGDDTDDGIGQTMGQSESKKSSKKADGGGVHTKGTAMSFGFKKHKSFRQQTAATNATATAPASDGGARTGQGGGGNGGGGGAIIETVPGAVANQIKKFNANGNVVVEAALEREKAERELVQATVISNPGVDAGFSDQNGNTGSVESVEDGGRTGGGRSTPRLQPAKKDSHGAPYRSNRFGFRTNNIVRPASAGLQPRVVANELDKHYSTSNNNNNVHPNNNNNNNNVYVTGDKRRSKSASSAASVRTTFTPVVTGGGGAGTGNAPPVAHQGAHAGMTLHQHAYGGGGGVLHRPQPKYQTANTKITHSSTTPANAGDSTGGGSISSSSNITTGGTYQQAASKGEHKNTLRTVGGQPMAMVSTQQQQQQQHQYTPASETGQSAAPVAGTLHGKPPPAAVKVGHQEQPLVASKFTLHSSSLPKPQYPVSISLSSSTSGGGPMSGHVTAMAPSARYTMDTKGAKHAVNVSRKEFAGTHGSGVGGGDGTVVALEDTTTATTSSIRMPRQRYRSLEMVMSGRHKFEVRDLEALTTEPIVPLPLPELPSAFGSTANQRTAPLSGLIRSSELTASGLGGASDGAPDDDDIDINDNRYEVAEEEPTPSTPRKNSQSEGESFEEEKLQRDNNSSEKSLKSALVKEEGTKPPPSGIPGGSRVSWCDVQGEQSGRAAAPPTTALLARQQQQQRSLEKEEEDVSSVTITAGHSSFSSMSAPVPMDMSLDMTNLDSVSEMLVSLTDPGTDPLPAAPAADRMYRNEQAKFAAMAAAISDVVLLEDETSPTDSLVSSCTDHSDDARKPAVRHGAKKGAEKTKEKEKDVDEISPELDDLISPVSPGTPTHASNSLSLSDGGRDFLIDDEIADQPGLVFDEGSTIDVGSINLNLASQQTDTPTLKDSHNNRSTAVVGGDEVTPKATPPVPKPRKILPEAYESPALSRKSARSNGRMARAESLDTLSPCDSIASDDFMLDFDCNSSIDSIDRAARSSVGGSATGLHSLDGLQLWNELENKGGHIIREWSTLLRSNPTPSGHNTSRESITSQLPARARLLTRRLQNNATPTNGSESPRSIDSLPRRTFSGSYKTATLSQFHNNLANNNNNNMGPGSLHGLTDSASTATNSAEDLTLLDKSLRNSMLQDVVHFKKELVRLRRILQEDEENLMMTDTLNPFENNNGQFFTTAAAAAVAACNNNNSSSLSSAATDGQENGTAGTVGLEMNRQQQENVLIRESSVAALALLEDQRQELADLRRQGEMTAKDRIIRQQQNMIEKLEADREKQQQAAASATQSAPTTISNESASGAAGDINQTAETISTATQTERLRPVSFGGQEGLGSRSEHPTTPRNGLRTPTASNITGSSNGPNTPQQHHNHHAQTPSRSAPSKTQISSVYTQLSSVRHSMAGASVSAINAAESTATSLRRTSVGSSHNLSSVGLSSNGTKPVRTTHIGTLAITGRQHTTGDRIPVSSRHNGHHKLLPSPIRSTVASAGPATSPSSGPPATVNTNIGKRSASIIKPPSSFACNGGAMLPAVEMKSKSAPSTPSGAKLLTAPATGASTGGCDDMTLDSTVRTTACVVLSSSDAGFSSGSCENESSGKSDTSDEGSETEKNSLPSPSMPVNGKLLTSLKLLPSTGSTAATPAVAAGGGCGGDGGATTLVPQPGHTANGIVGH
ncbi:mucin-19 isoform X2 [Anopheles aquasalis]|uniref:mucin-19 isoform X2 n=1 Tax=Anopheles aquasalis TaxID=42839 RepID=UPI00215A156E|nr:mucin-19 isoform X2 [Anopheles aquasalis]